MEIQDHELDYQDSDMLVNKLGFTSLLPNLSSYFIFIFIFTV